MNMSMVNVNSSPYVIYIYKIYDIQETARDKHKDMRRNRAPRCKNTCGERSVIEFFIK